LKKGLGAFGESWAVGYLTRQGFRIVERNVRFRTGELDIVALDGSELVFVEVKTRSSSRFGSPEASITPSRYERLARTIEAYVADRGLQEQQIRIDVMALEVDAGGSVVRAELLRGIEPPGR
jgi:putative endonuclease